MITKTGRFNIVTNKGRNFKAEIQSTHTINSKKRNSHKMWLFYWCCTLRSKKEKESRIKIEDYKKYSIITSVQI